MQVLPWTVGWAKNVFFGVIILLLSACSETSHKQFRDPPIRVGILHSVTGTMASSERGVIDATHYAIHELNASGGVLGRLVIPVLRDGASSGAVFAEAAEALIQKDQVAVIFGCWTSDSRRSVLPVLERFHHLLFYPVQYEGMERSAHVVYLGSVPNQQIIPAVQWAIENLGSRFYLVGSDYVFPRAAHEVIRDQIHALQGSIVGESFAPLGSEEFADIVGDIIASGPDVILNTVNGDGNIALFRELRARGVTSRQIPTLSFSIAEEEVGQMGVALGVGDYAAWHYFQSQPGLMNRRFVEGFQAQFGGDRVVTAPMEAAYSGVHLWAQAVERAGTTENAAVRTVLGGMSVAAPRGPLSVDSRNQHVWMPVRIGRIRENGQFTIVWSSPKPVRPMPFPRYRSEADWERFLVNLYEEWGNSWSGPVIDRDPHRP